MRVFDLTGSDAYMFPIKVIFDCDGNLTTYSVEQIATIKINSELFYTLVKEQKFIILMEKEANLGIRKYECRVTKSDINTFNISFRFLLLGELTKQEYRQRTIKKLINEI